MFTSQWEDVVWGKELPDLDQSQPHAPLGPACESDLLTTGWSHHLQMGLNLPMEGGELAESGPLPQSFRLIRHGRHVTHHMHIGGTGDMYVCVSGYRYICVCGDWGMDLYSMHTSSRWRVVCHTSRVVFLTSSRRCMWRWTRRAALACISCSIRTRILCSTYSIPHCHMSELASPFLLTNESIHRLPKHLMKHFMSASIYGWIFS